MGAVAQAMIERVEDQVLLDLGHGHSDHDPLGGIGGIGRLAHGRIAGAGEDRPIGHADGIGADFPAGREQHGAVHGIFQFTHIARPFAGDEMSLGCFGERQRLNLVCSGILADEMFRQGKNIGRALAQGRQRQIDDVQTEEQVLAECAFGDGLAQIAV